MVFATRASARTQPSAPPSAARLRRISRMMVVACWVLLVALPVALLGYWATAPDALLAQHAHLSPQALQAPIGTGQRAAAGALMAVPLVLLLAGIAQARQCFAMFARGEVFTRDATSRLRRFAGWVAWAALAAIVAEAAASVVLTLGNPAGQRHLAIGIGSNQVFTLFVAGLVWLMAAVIDEGQSLAAENAGFV